MLELVHDMAALLVAERVNICDGGLALPAVSEKFKFDGVATRFGFDMFSVTSTVSGVLVAAGSETITRPLNVPDESPDVFTDTVIVAFPEPAAGAAPSHV
jgi:hypothetical protein